MLYPFVMVLGVISGASFGGDTGNGVRLIRDVVTDRDYDGQALYDQLEQRNT
ncbi:hypothetical protein [Paenibacillus illinoisensis]|uniref:hypothetical protein n=1 Tax=Paenibacillus illinoisensis TaxID=59845 RepID=UPI001C8DB997|nr:hypothetical protein [Paenibacillus illinoisensis]